jgi:hypothetical protein
MSTATLFVVLSVLSAYSQKNKKEPMDTIGVFRTMNDSVIYMCQKQGSSGGANMTSEGLSYTNSKGKYKSELQRDIKYMVIYNRVFICYPQNKKGKNLQLMEVVAVNSECILLQYWNVYQYFYIYDHNGSMLMEERLVRSPEGIDGLGYKKAIAEVQEDNRQTIEILKQYFGGCTDLISAMEANLEAGVLLTNQIAYYECEGSPPVERIFSALNDMPWFNK